MKYLQLHKLIWLILVLALTFIDITLVAIDYLIYVIWNFKLSFPFKETWKEMHYKSELVPVEEGSKVKILKGRTDNSIKDTIKRRYHILFN